MTTTPERLSELESAVSGFVTNWSSRWNRKKLLSYMNGARAAIISQLYQTDRRIHPDWTQELVIPFDGLAQNSDCYSTFPCPSVIKMSKMKDGFIFIGSDDFKVAYSRVTTMSELVAMQSHPVANLVRTNGTAALYDDGAWKIYSGVTEGLIQSCGVKGIFNNPQELPYFNLDVDMYPVDNMTFELMKSSIVKNFLAPIEATVPDIISDGKDTSNIQNQRRR